MVMGYTVIDNWAMGLSVGMCCARKVILRNVLILELACFVAMYPFVNHRSQFTISNNGPIP
jgi:hypothetical protein